MKKIIVTVVISLVAFSAFSMVITDSAGSETSSRYRRIITVDNSGSSETLTDYQIFLNVTYDSDMQSDFDDLRFTWYNETSGQEVNIDYWLDKHVDSEYALVWVEVPLIRGLGEEVLYMYYGDPDAISGSNGEETFVFFDDYSTNTTSDYEISRNPKGKIGWNPNGWLLLNASVLEAPGRSSNFMVRHKAVQINETEENYWLETKGKAFGDGVLDYFGVMKEYKHDPTPTYPNHYSSAANMREEPSNSCRITSTWRSFAEFSESESLSTSPKNEWYRIGLGTSPNGTVIGSFFEEDYEEIHTLVNQTIHYDNEWRVSLIGSKRRELDTPTNLCVYFDYLRVRKFTDPEPSYSIGPEEPLPATVDIDPDTLNLKSKGEWITCYIELPEGYNVSDIDRATILLNDTIPVDPFFVELPIESLIGDYDEDGIPDLMVKFNRTTVSEYIINKGITHGHVTLTITGEVDGTLFEGSDIIRVRMPGDVNSNRIVDIVDLVTVGIALGSTDPYTDLNEDEITDICDVVTVAINFGNTY